LSSKIDNTVNNQIEFTLILTGSLNLPESGFLAEEPWNQIVKGVHLVDEEEPLSKESGPNHAGIPIHHRRSLSEALQEACSDTESHVIVSTPENISNKLITGDFLDGIRRVPEALHLVLPEGRYIMQKRRNPLLQIFRNFRFWLQTGYKERLQDTAAIGFTASGIPESVKSRRLKAKTPYELLVRVTWNVSSIIPFLERDNWFFEQKKANMVSRRGNVFRNMELFLVYAFYINPGRILQLLKRDNFKAFIERELLRPEQSAGVLAASVGTGILIGMSPFWGWQTLLALGSAVLFRLNKVITVTASYISIPPMVPLILYFSYRMGGVVLGNHWEGLQSDEITFEYVKRNIIQYIVGAFLLGALSGLTGGIITYFTIRTNRRFRFKKIRKGKP
jgi:uncharacterized protein (DUF2062 family)